MKRKSFPKKGARKRIILDCLTEAKGHFDDDYNIEHDAEYDLILESAPALRSRKELDRVIGILDAIQRKERGAR
jgi:hypothetical protein